MSVQLLIRDGSPDWYLSSDIWVVPGANPAGTPGTPIAGQPAYLWAHVANTGDTLAGGVRVDFWWANPALQVLRSTATMVGSAYVDLSPGASQDVLCLVPWFPVIVNGGHECLVAVANHPGDPLPSPLPDAFDPPTYRQVAQRNLTVLVVAPHMLTLPITIGAPHRIDKSVVVAATVGGRLDELSLARLGLKGLKPAEGAHAEVGLGLQPRCVEPTGPIGPPKLEMRVARGTTNGVHVAVRAPRLGKGTYQLVTITEHSADRVLGGIGLVLVHGEEARQ